jgi:hypothetical protein
VALSEDQVPADLDVAAGVDDGDADSGGLDVIAGDPHVAGGEPVQCCEADPVSYAIRRDDCVVLDPKAVEASPEHRDLAVAAGDDGVARDGDVLGVDPADPASVHGVVGEPDPTGGVCRPDPGEGHRAGAGAVHEDVAVDHDVGGSRG